MRMKEESVEVIWESWKKGIKECETKREIKIRKKSWANITGGTQVVKGRRETSTRRMEDGRQRKEKYLRLRREFREKYKKKEERNRKQIEEVIKNITREVQMWKFVNLDRKNARIVEENINIEDWEEYFLELLEGVRCADRRKKKIGKESKGGDGRERNRTSIKEDGKEKSDRG